MTGGWLDDTRASYDTVAESYADQTRHLMDDTPEERAVLALFADVVRARGGGAGADVGCGPGRITAELRQLGVDAFGIDLSPGMRVWLAWPSPPTGRGSVAVNAREEDRRPVIGLTTYSEPARMLAWDREFAMLHASYLAATERAGGIAVLLPAQGAGADEVRDRAEETLNRIDGLVLTGGADVDPARYGQARQERTSPPRVLRDEWELALATAALRRGVPLLAVCRGLQILNVALGGSLHQHLPDVVGHHGHQPSPGIFGVVEVATEPGTRTAELIGSLLQVRCHHHQAVARLAPGLTVTGRAADGTVEAVEVTGSSFAVAVQWHPEEDSEDARLFAALVRAGRQYGAAPRRGDDLEEATS